MDIIICAKAQRPERAGIVEDQKQAPKAAASWGGKWPVRQSWGEKWDLRATEGF